jgi:hypothetical protein
MGHPALHRSCGLASGMRQPEPAGDVGRIVKQEKDTGPLNSSQAEEEARVGFEEVAEQAEGQVGDHEEFEGIAGEEGGGTL